MPHIELRVQAGASDPRDLTIWVQDKTYDYLMTTVSPDIRISAFLDRDYDHVESTYAEVFVHETCGFVTTVTRVIPGSKRRAGVVLPGPMKEGEQLTVLVTRSPLSSSQTSTSSEISK